MAAMPDMKIDALRKEDFDAIIDVRSPAEFADDHIPGAVNCPVLSDAERAEIGTIYKQISPFAARKKGAVLVARNISSHIEAAFSAKEKSWRPLIYCWRGGQRSGAMQIMLREIGWRACRLDGGYKSYRSHVLEQLKLLPGQFRYIVINGPTGSGKTRILKALAELGSQVLDLEGMANHKGSVLGPNPDRPKQSCKAFDTALIEKLSGFNRAEPVFVEAEGRRIGIIHLPPLLYETMRTGRILQIKPAIKARVKFLIEDYSWLTEQPETLREYLSVLKAIRGKDTVGRWHELIEARDWPALVEDLLITHYDPLYKKSSSRDFSAGIEEDVFAAEKLEPETFLALAKEIQARLDSFT
jgi:tRNA 2-selenouridine synthase